MNTRHGPIIDMTPSGDFAREPIAGPTLGVIFARVVAFAVVLGIAAMAFWLAVFTIPVLVVLGLGAYAYLRYQLRRSGGVVRFTVGPRVRR